MQLRLAATLVTLACIQFTVSSASHAPEPDGQARIVPRGQPVTIDGSIAGAEWQDADSVSFAVGDSVNATVRLKHDGSNLLAVFVVRRVPDVGFCIPELLLDPNNDRSQATAADDWWFHVSAQACAAQGRIGDYSLCARTPDWGAARLYQIGGTPTAIDTIEVRIPFAKIGVQAGRTFGLALRVEYQVPAGSGWSGREGLWPAGAGASAPSTWGTFRIGE